MCTTKAKISHIQTIRYKFDQKGFVKNLASLAITGSSQNELTTFLITPAIRSLVLKVKTHCSVSNMRPIKRNYKTSHSVPIDLINAGKQKSHIALLSHALWLETSQKEWPTHDMSLKWLKVSFHTEALSHISGSLLHIPRKVLETKL